MPFLKPKCGIMHHIDFARSRACSTSKSLQHLGNILGGILSNVTLPTKYFYILSQHDAGLRRVCS